MASIYKDESPAFLNLRIVLLGACGVGKSATGNAILGREAFKETPTRVSEEQRGRAEDRNISVIDTPGFFNTELTDEDLQNEMMKSLSLSHPGPHVFLLIVKLDTYTEDDAIKIVEKIQESFGEEVLKFTLVLFTGRDKMSRKECNQFIESERTKEFLSYFKGRFHTINSKSECTSKQIMKLLREIDNLVKNNEGQHYTIEIYMKNKLREPEERKKQEHLRKTNMEIKEEKDQPEQIKGIHQEETTKVKQSKEKQQGDYEEKQHDVSQEGEEYGPMRLPDDGETAQENLESQMEDHEDFTLLSEFEIAQINLSSHDVRIVLLGRTGAGKSTTGNTILGRNQFKVDCCAKSVTKHCERHETTVNGRSISVTDTPGLFDTSITNEEMKSEMEKCVEMSVPGPHVFLLVIRLDVRITEEEKNTVKWIQENFGEDAAHYTIILFTHADALRSKSLDEYITESSDLLALTERCGGRYHSFNNADRENQTQVIELLQKIDNMVMINGGMCYTNEIYKRMQETIEQVQPRSRVLIVIGGTVAAAAVAGAVLAVAVAGGPKAALKAGAAVAEAAVAAAGGPTAALKVVADVAVAAAGGQPAAVKAGAALKVGAGVVEAAATLKAGRIKKSGIFI